MGSYCTKSENHRNLQVLSGTEEGDGGVKDLSNRGKPLRIFKVIASGTEVVAYICSYHVNLSIDEGLLMVTLDGFCKWRNTAVSFSLIKESLCKSILNKEPTFFCLYLHDKELSSLSSDTAAH